MFIIFYQRCSNVCLYIYIEKKILNNLFVRFNIYLTEINPRLNEAI